MSELFSRLFGEVSWCWPKDEQVKFREAQVRLGHFIYFELSGDPENQLGDRTADPQGQAGDEAELQDPSSRHRRVRQVHVHEEPAGGARVGVLHEGETRCSQSESDEICSWSVCCSGDCEQSGHHCLPHSLSNGPAEGEH